MFPRPAARAGRALAKRADSAYSRQALQGLAQAQVRAGQELVIGGYTAPKGSRTDFGALLVGYWDGRPRCGTPARWAPGSTTQLPPWAPGCATSRQDESPFADPREIRERARCGSAPSSSRSWASANDNAGRLRHPRFLGLRDESRRGRWCARRVAERRPATISMHRHAGHPAALEPLLAPRGVAHQGTGEADGRRLAARRLGDARTASGRGVPNV